MIASLLPLLLDGRVLLGLGGLAAIIYAYFKGRGSGKKVIEAQIAADRQQLLERVTEAAIDNKELERKTRDEIRDINNATDDELLDKFLQLKSAGPRRPEDS